VLECSGLQPREEHLTVSTSKRGARRKAKKPQVKKGLPTDLIKKAVAGSGAPVNLSDDDFTMTWEAGEVTFQFKITEIRHDPTTGNLTLSAIPVEDSIHPYRLRFEPPLMELASGEQNGFNRHWEKLTYAFGLPDPAAFPALPLQPEDREICERFVDQCRHLAGYSVINDDGGMTIASDTPGAWTITADLPSREAFGGTAVAFRQIHNHGEEAAFDKVKGRLFKATNLLDQQEQSRIRAIMAQWVDARGKLMNHTLPTIVCQEIVRKKNSSALPGYPVSFRDINPEDLLLTFNYGDTIHWGDHRQKLVNLTADPNLEAYYRHALVTSILGLSHLYFGWSALVTKALGT
jgi:hypothetical protein